MVQIEKHSARRDVQFYKNGISSNSTPSGSPHIPKNPSAKEGKQNSNIKTAPLQGNGSETVILSNKIKACASSAGMQKTGINASSKMCPSSRKSVGVRPKSEISEGMRPLSCQNTGLNPLIRASKSAVSGTPTPSKSASPGQTVEKAVPKQKIKGLVMGPHDPTQEAGPMEMKMPAKNRRRKSSGRARGRGRVYGRQGERGRR